MAKIKLGGGKVYLYDQVPFRTDFQNKSGFRMSQVLHRFINYLEVKGYVVARVY